MFDAFCCFTGANKDESNVIHKTSDEHWSFYSAAKTQFTPWDNFDLPTSLIIILSHCVGKKPSGSSDLFNLAEILRSSCLTEAGKI